MNQQTIRSSYLEDDEVAENNTRLDNAFNKLKDAISKLEIAALNKNQQTNVTVDLKKELDKMLNEKAAMLIRLDEMNKKSNKLAQANSEVQKRLTSMIENFEGLLVEKQD
jgi:fructose-1,6-bisphosphatase